MKLFIVIILAFLSLNSQAQDYSIQYKDKALSEILFELKDQFNVQFSFRPEVTDQCIITVNRKFDSKDELIEFLVTTCDLSFSKNNDIYVIHSKKKESSIQKKKLFTGVVRDMETKEVLPYSIIRLKQQSISTNENGHFALYRIEDSLAAQVKYLGYQIKNIVLYAEKNQTIELTNNPIEIEDLVIYSIPEIYDIQTGEQAANIKLNQSISSYLPGIVDHSLYNMLRLQAGIMAAGENSSDYTIWGSFSGQNLVQYDQIRLFKLSSFDENQSVVHPRMIQEIDVYKGGFDARYGNTIGGIVDIIGREGNQSEIDASLDFNNRLISTYVNIPIQSRFTIQTAFRKSFEDVLNKKSENNERKKNIDFYNPQSKFGDIHVKLSGRLSNNQSINANLLYSDDQVDYQYLENTSARFAENREENQTQVGSSFVYNRAYNKGHSSATVLNFSKLGFDQNLYQKLKRPNNGHQNDDFEDVFELSNSISEFRINHTHSFPSFKKHSATLGTEWVSQEATNTASRNYSRFETNENQKLNRWAVVAQDEFYLAQKVKILAGLRTDYIVKNNDWFIQPRLQASYDFSDQFHITGAVGRYNQFLNKNAVVEDDNNVIEIWELIDFEQQDALRADHINAGLHYHKSEWQLSVEAYRKFIDQLNEYQYNRKLNTLTSRIGTGKSSGIDVYAKKQLNQHEAWFSYTLGKVVQQFDETNEYSLAPQNQTHEAKVATILNFAPIYFSTNFVYGSGLELSRRIDDNKLIPYQRWDVALIFEQNRNSFDYKIGASLLNVLNHANIKYQYTINAPDIGIIYSQSIPFTALLNVSIEF